MNKLTIMLLFGITLLLGSFVTGPDSAGAFWLWLLCLVLAIVQWVIIKIFAFFWNREDAKK